MEPSVDHISSKLQTIEAGVGEVHFGLLAGDHTYQTKFVVKNVSLEPLTLTGSVSVKPEDLTLVSFPTAPIASGESAFVTVQLYCTDHGHFDSTVVIRTNAGDELEVPVSATIMTPHSGKPLLKDNIFRVPNPAGRIPISESEPESDYEIRKKHQKKEQLHQRLETIRMEELKKKFADFHQEHVFKYYESLPHESREFLLKDLESIDLTELKAIYESSKVQSASISPSELEPFPKVVKSYESSQEDLERWRNLGLKNIAEGKVALILMAGGQATRLGVGFPKGMLDVGLPSGKSLFQIQAERIVKLRELAIAYYTKVHGGAAPTASIPLYIMTSPGQTEIVEKFHRESNCFGLDGADLKFFEQCTLPCLTPEGKIILESGYKVARAPDGHGGLYKALGLNGVHKDMAKRGCEYGYVYCVDNILVRVGDPTYIGYCIEKNFSFGYKVVAKAYPEEPAGVVCIRKGITDYVEYSELPKEVAVLRNESTGELLYNAANILNLFYTRQFLTEVIEEAETNMQYHIAKKKIPYADEKGATITPASVNGWKFEKFVLDCTPAAKNNVGVFMVPREEEFSPIKNGWGEAKDSPDTAKLHIFNLHKTYIKKAGGVVSKSILGDDEAAVEVSPLLSYEGEGMEANVSGVSFESLPIHLKSPSEQ